MTSSIKYVGMDVHRESISLAVRNAAGKIGEYISYHHEDRTQS
jgi:hypothetical protein